MDKLQSSLQELEQKLAETLHYRERQALFDKAAEQRFENNLDIFKVYYPALHKQIRDFVPRDDFRVFVSPSGEGNYQPEGAPVPLYGDNPVEQSRQQVEKNTQKAQFGRSALYRGADAGTKADKRLHMQYMARLAETFKETVADDEPLLDTLPAHYPTCIMFGVGLGYALSALLEAHSFDYLFVCEPDFETFYASLFCTDWESILKNADAQSGCVFLHIGVTYETFFEEIQKIYNDIGAFSLISSFCYQHTPGEKVNALIRTFFKHFFQIQLGYGFYNDAVTGIAHTIENFNTHHCPVFVPPPKKNHSLKSLTAYVVANGPSVDEAIDVLRENREDVVIFAAGTALSTLLKLGIIPDFHVLVERPKNTYDVLVETTDLNELKKLNLLAVDVMYPEVPPLYKWTGLGLKGPEASTLMAQFEYLKTHQYIVGSLFCASPLVANTALSFATMMGFGEIYMFGVDNGYPMSGQSHSEHSIYLDPGYKNRYMANPDAPHVLEGNLSGQVKATTLMLQAKEQMEALIRDYSHIQFYNVGSGAKVAGAEPLTVDDILCVPLKQHKEQVVEDIKSRFFSELVINNPEQAVGIEELESLCDYLLEIAHRPYSTRQEASDLLRAQARVVFAYRGRKFGHLFHVIKGTLLYFHGPLISLLYMYADEKKSLGWFAEAMAVWIGCIEAMKADYKHAWNKRCEYSLEEILYLKSLTDK